MRRVTALTLALLLSVGVGSLHAQVCGDADGDGGKDLTDVVQIIYYLSGMGPVNRPANADMDGRAGITIADDQMLVNWIFVGEYVTFNCAPTLSYSMTPSSADTVFFPLFANIPDGIDSVDLPVITKFASNTGSFYLPFLKAGSGNSKFALKRIVRLEDDGVVFPGSGSVSTFNDTVTLLGCDFDGSFQGRDTMFVLRYGRTEAGAGTAAPQLVDRSSLLRPSVEKNYDLFLPVINYYTLEFPPETLKVAPTSLDFTAAAGFAADNSAVLHFTSSGVPITFQLTATEPWITFVDTGAVGFRTPADVVVNASAAAVGMGNYGAKIQMVNLSPSAPTEVADIDVGFVVRAPLAYPTGDLDCDGICDIADLTLLIDHLYLSLVPLPICPN
jgi:hypothetical protein